jgi:hypothetical protein
MMEQQAKIDRLLFRLVAHRQRKKKAPQRVVGSPSGLNSEYLSWRNPLL